MDVNASMNATMAERLNVSGAMLVKLFGRHDDEVASFSRSAGEVRDLGIKSALYGASSSPPSASWPPSAPRSCTGWARRWSSRAT
jgi:hypothetical protein